MAGMTFTEGSNVNNSVFGKSQEPVKMFLEKRAESFEQASMIKELFMETESKHYAEKYTSMTAMDGFKPVGENGEYPKDEMRESYDSVIENMTWKDSFEISREMIDDSRTMDLKKKPASFIAGYYRTRERFGAALIGGAVRGQTGISFGGKAFSTKSADGVCMFSTAHTSILGKANQSNLFADAFSSDALMAAESRMQDFRGDNGEVLAVAPTTILIPNDYALKKAVFAAIGADKDPDTANNGFNYNFGRWTVIVWQYLNEFITSGTSPWMLVDANYNGENGSAIWQERVKLEVRSEVVSNDANQWKGYARFSAGFNDWRGYCCGGVSGGTQMISTD